MGQERKGERPAGYFWLGLFWVRLLLLITGLLSEASERRPSPVGGSADQRYCHHLELGRNVFSGPATGLVNQKLYLTKVSR